MKNTALFHSIAFLALVALVSVLLVGCAADGSLTSQGQKGVTTALQIAQIALSNYATIASAQSSGGQLTNAQIATLASNDLSGLAALAQANVGSTPAAANLAQGAANPAVGSAVVSALPPAPMTQSTVNTLYSAAAQASAK